MSGSHVQPQERNRIARAYQSGLSLAEVGQVIGRSTTTVRRALSREEVPVRKTRVDVDPEEVVRMYDKEKMSMRQIGRRLNVSYGTVHRIVSANTTPRTRGGHTRDPNNGGAHAGAETSQGTPGQAAASS